MVISVAKRAALVLVCLVLYSTCGELETLFPSNGTYQIRILVNDNALEDCSIIRSNDKIRPYFASSVINDPDLIGLLVYLEDSQGKAAGDKIQYTLLPYAGETALTEEELTALLEKRTAEPDEATEANIEIAVKSLGAELPCFPLSKELKIGPYVLVFEAVGKRETLSRTENNVYYLGSTEFNLKDISLYLPGLSGPQLISPGTVIMLETSLAFDSRLDPYVIWYNGKNIISEGKISDGAGKLLWKAPEEVGFYSLRLEALPLHLKRGTYAGLSREIALPISPKAVSLGYFFEDNGEYTARSPLSMGTVYPEQAKTLMAAVTADERTVSYPVPELLQWYLFEGSLHSSLSTLTNEQTLLPVKESRPRWAAAGQSYGLTIGPDDPYLLPSINFFREKKDQGGGILLFHIRPLSEGVIFSAFFPLESSATEGVRMDMIKKENVIVLRLALHLTATDTFVDLPVYPSLSASDDFIPIVVEFYIRPYQLEAKISVDENLQNRAGSISLPGASGEGRIRLGGGIDKSMLDFKHEAAALPSEEINDSVPVETFPDTVWDELAILFSAVPLLPEKLPVPAVIRQDAVVNEKVEEADSDNSADSIVSIQEQKTQERSLLTVFPENP